MARSITRKQFLKTFGIGTSALLCPSQAYGFFSKGRKTAKSKILTKKKGYYMAKLNINDGRCKFCNTPIPGRWIG